MRNQKIVPCILALIICLQNIAFADTHTKDVILQLRWEHQFQFAGYYAALWQGYYADEGLNVQIKAGIDDNGHVVLAPVEVAEGRADFGVGAVDVLIAIDQGHELSVVSSFFQKSAVAYYMLENTRFNSVYDFTKLNVARRRNDLLDIELQALLTSEGLSPVQEALLPEETFLTFDDLITGKYDVIPEYLGKVKYQAQKKGYAVKTVKPVDFGIDFYGDSLFTSDGLAQKNPELVEAFRKATIKGWEYALENPEAVATQIVETFYPDAPDFYEVMDYNLFQAEQVRELTLYPVVQTGNINSFRWNTMAETLKELGLISEAVEMDAHIFDYRLIQEEKNARKAQYYQYITAFLITILIVAYILFVTKKNADLTDEINYRKKIEATIKRSNERYQTLFDSSFLGITMTNRNGHILQTNNKWSEMTGYSQDELKTMSIFDILHGDSAQAGNQEFKRLRDGDVESIELERFYVRKNNTRFWGHLFMTSVIDPETEEQAFLGMVLDITRKKLEQDAVKRAEERFRTIIQEVAQEIEDPHLKADFDAEDQLYDGKSRLSLKLERINIQLERMFKKELDENRKKEALLIYQARLAAMGEMVANIAHQWRQPLNNLGIILSNIEDAFKFNELDADEMGQSMGRAKVLIKKMSETIDDFRDFLKPQNEREAFRICETLDSLLNMLQENFEFHDIALNVKCSNDLKITGSKNHYGQAVFNVLNNAIDALSESDTANKEISITALESNEEIQLIIKDNGSGIPSQIIERIFDPYFSTKHENKGTGLGLYMVKNIIEGQMNGSVKVESDENGASFTISVPKDHEMKVI